MPQMIFDRIFKIWKYHQTHKFLDISPEKSLVSKKLYRIPELSKCLAQAPKNYDVRPIIVDSAAVMTL